MADATGGGGSAVGGGAAAPAPAAAPARGRIGDLSGAVDPGNEPASAPQTMDEAATQRGGIGRGRPGRIPGDEGVLPPDAEAELEQQSAPTQQTDGDPYESEPFGDPEAQTEEQVQEAELGDDAPVFGMAPTELLAALRAAEQNGQVPQELLERLSLDVPLNDGRTMRATVGELRRGFMRGVDYTRKTEQIAEVRRQAEGVLQQDRERWDTWGKDPAKMYDDLEARGFVSLDDIINMRGPVIEIAQYIAEQRKAFLAMSPAEQSAFIREQQAITKQRELDERDRKLQDRDRQHRHRELTAKHARDLGQMVPVAFGKVKLQDSPLAQRVFKDRLGAIVNSLERFQGLTQQMVDDAALQTVDTLRELARFGEPGAKQQPGAGAPQQRPRQSGGALPATGLSGGVRPNGQGARPAQPKRGRMGDLSPLRGKS